MAASFDSAATAIPVEPMPDAAYHGPVGAEGFERLTSKSNSLRPIGFLMRGWKVSQSVGRIVLADKSTGSGFMIPNDIFITNNHVLSSAETARTARIEFNYQQTPEGGDAQPDPYPLDPDNGFATSLTDAQGGDDWTAVKVKGNPTAKWGSLSLVTLPTGSPKEDDEVIIIQHPMGGPKQIALSHNLVVFADARRLQYLTDTLAGSSGSPVLDIQWRVVGLHHSWKTLSDPNTKAPLIANQGTHINVVIEGLKAKGLL